LTNLADSQNLPSGDVKLEGGPSGRGLSDLKHEQTEIRKEMATKRKELWEKIRPLLTEQNLADLEKMRRGEYTPASTITSKDKGQ
jgi:hypothetical protein